MASDTEAVERHERIWLQHPADADPDTGPMWCQDKVWPNETGEHEPTEYVRADMHTALAAERDAAIASRDAMDRALQQIATSISGRATLVAMARAALAGGPGRG